MDLAQIETEIVDAVRGVLARHRSSAGSGEEPVLAIQETGGLSEPYVHPWPTNREEFPSGRRYEVRATEGQFAVLVAETKRDSWGLPDRGRVIVFAKLSENVSPARYPWIEFVETDEAGLWSAGIPRPESPRKNIAAGDPLPARFLGMDVRRNDELFESVRTGPALRLVLRRDQEREMIEHGHWVARLRGHIG